MVFGAGLCAFSGVTLFALGATFNYLVSLFHECTIRQGLFGRPVLSRPLERHFGWVGLVAMGLGIVVGILSLVLAMNGWEMSRLWFWMLGAAMSVIVGLQLMIFWIVMQVLGELSERQVQVAQDLQGKPCEG